MDFRKLSKRHTPPPLDRAANTGTAIRLCPTCRQPATAFSDRMGAVGAMMLFYDCALCGVVKTLNRRASE